MTKEEFEVIKASGEREPFNVEKLRSSLSRNGISDSEIDEIIRELNPLFRDGVTTQKIYREAYRLLRKRSARAAGRYKLKEAILELGPTGYPFERFISEIMIHLGFETEVGSIVQGDCVKHEIDVIAHKADQYFLVECKFHNKKENRCNVQVPLYIQSRFLDVKKNWTSQPGHEGQKHTGYVVTNTRFTDDAITYAKCVGLRLLSWDYPSKNGLKDHISRLNLHPVTCLNSLAKAEKDKLLKNDVVLVQQIARDQKILDKTGVDKRKINRIYKEAQEIVREKENSK